MISERRLAILNLIIEHYISTGEPMGSMALCRLLPYAVSSATVRNEMAYLSELGLLEQRHTSGGRTPSNTSYRYYIDSIMQEQSVSAYEKRRIKDLLEINAGDPERLLSDAARLISGYTNCVGFSCTSEDELDCIQDADLIPAGRSKAMLVMLTVGGKIKSSLINVPRPADDDYRYLFHEVINRRFAGIPVADVAPALIQSCVHIAGERIFDLLPALTLLCSLCNEVSQSRLSIEGETNLLSHGEFGGEVHRLLSFLADKGKVIDFIKSVAAANAKTVMFIGDENPVYEMKNTSTVIANFKYGNNQRAALGMIGSTRINYKYIIPVVRYIIEKVDDLLSKGGTI